MSEHEGHRARLRESFIETGIEGMADHQVLELLLTYALPRAIEWLRSQGYAFKVFE